MRFMLIVITGQGHAEVTKRHVVLSAHRYQARIQGGGAGAGAHPWDGRTRAEGAGSLVSRAERRDTGVS